METGAGASVEAVTYVMVRPLVEDRRPSQLYHSVILEGAREHGLPGHYLETLNTHLGSGVVFPDLAWYGVWLGWVGVAGGRLLSTDPKCYTFLESSHQMQTESE